MSALKTTQTSRSVEKFLEGIFDKRRRRECNKIIGIMKEITREKPKMWGSSIVGFGTYHYKYESGREGDWFLTGFSPRKQNLTIYVMSGLDRNEPMMKKLGRHKTGKSCLYINRIEDVDVSVLKQLIRGSIEQVRKIYR